MNDEQLDSMLRLYEKTLPWYMRTRFVVCMVVAAWIFVMLPLLYLIRVPGLVD